MEKRSFPAHRGAEPEAPWARRDLKYLLILTVIGQRCAAYLGLQSVATDLRSTIRSAPALRLREQLRPGLGQREERWGHQPATRVRASSNRISPERRGL